MIFIKKTEIQNVSAELADSGFVPGAGSEAFILANEEALQAVCVFEVKEQYVLIQKVLCPSGQGVYIDAVVRALLSSKLDEGYVYALLGSDNDEVVRETLKKMTGFLPVFPRHEYMVGVLFQKEDITQESLYTDSFKLFMHPACSAGKSK